MAEQIWKFPFGVEGRFELRMPVGAKILKVEVQNGKPTMWALVNPSKPEEVRRFLIIGTGHDLPPDLPIRYIETFQHPPFVWHLFERVG